MRTFLVVDDDFVAVVVVVLVRVRVQVGFGVDGVAEVWVRICGGNIVCVPVSRSALWPRTQVARPAHQEHIDQCVAASEDDCSTSMPWVHAEELHIVVPKSPGHRQPTVASAVRLSMMVSCVAALGIALAHTALGSARKLGVAASSVPKAGLFV